ncbi:NADH-quinone oxidoreductase subunit C [Streptomyces sp. NPDC087908]|uniref:NADH-quinone oxidoreductase subunit C n=1 Tax=Streptomyces sp. NPDC087908 TaxID=3365820 RepID=UPI0038203EA7
MTAYDSLPGAVTEVFGEEATAEQAYDLLTVDVPPASWTTALETARDVLGCTYFDWLSAVDEPGTGFRVCAHVAAVGEGRPRRLLLRTTVPHSAPVLPTAIGVYAGAGWHERETHEMFGVDFTGHPHLVPLLLPENFEGHPLRKDFVLAARVAKAWPGAKEPGESHDGGPKRRQMLPPGVPDPNEWGPLKGQLPPAPARPARAAAGDRPARRTRTTTEAPPPEPTPAATPDTARPARRTRSVTEGSASQTGPETSAAEAPTARPPRRNRSVSEGSASQTGPEASAAEAPTARPPRRNRSVSEGSASQSAPAPESAAEAGPGADAQPPAARPPRRNRSVTEGSASQSTPDAPAPRAEPAPPRTRSSDAPWHHARPAFDEKAPTTPATEGKPTSAPEPAAAPESEPAPESRPEPMPPAAPAPEPEPPAKAAPAPEGKPEPEAAPAPTPEPPRDPATEREPDPDPESEPEPETRPAPEPPAKPAPGPAGPTDPTTPAGGDPA